MRQMSQLFGGSHPYIHLEFITRFNEVAMGTKILVERDLHFKALNSQGKLKAWAEDRNPVVEVGSETYAELKAIKFQGMGQSNQWKSFEFPVAKVRGAEFNCSWQFTELNDELGVEGANVLYSFGWVQNVIRDRIAIRYNTNAIIMSPKTEWQPEGLRSNEIWYADRRPVSTKEATILSDYPDFIVPMFCPLTGAVVDDVLAWRRIELRTWLAVLSVKDQRKAYLFHLDWSLEVGVRFKRIHSLSEEANIKFANKLYLDTYRYHWAVVTPKDSAVLNSVNVDDVMNGVGEQYPRFGKANADQKITVSPFWF